jgi:chromosome segregation ATPase
LKNQQKNLTVVADQLVTANETISTLQGVIEELESDVTAFSEASKTSSITAEQLSTANDTIVTLQGIIEELDGASEQLTVANEKITTLEIEISELSCKVEASSTLVLEAAKTTSEHLQLVVNLEVAGAAMTEFQSRISELECEIANARNDLGVSDVELIDFRRASEESSGIVDELKRTMLKVQATADELTQQVLCLESQLENSTASLQEEKVDIYMVICLFIYILCTYTFVYIQFKYDICIIYVPLYIFRL